MPAAGIERAETGIDGLDELLQGGFPKPSVVYIVGDPGTGKTTFVMQSLFHGARKGERGLYITSVSEPIFAVKKFMSIYSFYDEKLVEEEKIHFEDLGASVRTEEPERALGLVQGVVERFKPQRIVMDPLPPPYLFTSTTAHRRYLYGLFTYLKKLDVVALVTGEKMPEGAVDVESYMADGVIAMDLRAVENPFAYRTFLQVKKMRGTKHTKDILSLEISEDGLKVFRLQRVI